MVKKFVRFVFVSAVVVLGIALFAACAPQKLTLNGSVGYDTTSQSTAVAGANTQADPTATPAPQIVVTVIAPTAVPQSTAAPAISNSGNSENHIDININVDAAGSGAGSAAAQPAAEATLAPEAQATAAATAMATSEVFHDGDKFEGCGDRIPAPLDPSKAQIVTVPANCVVLGDIFVMINGQKVKIHDDGIGEATALWAKTEIQVVAPWGAGTEKAKDWSDADAFAKAIVPDEITTGCGSEKNCTRVRVVVATSDEIQYHRIFDKDMQLLADLAK